MNVLIAGEGPTELGEWAKEPVYREPDRSRSRRGIIEALLGRERRDGWEVVDGLLWSRIRKYKAGDHRRAESRNVLGLALAADEAGCDVVAFCRDNDGDPRRKGDVEAGIEMARREFGDLRIIGGMAVEMIEAWVLAFLGDIKAGDIKAEEYTDPKQVLAERNIRSVSEKVEVIEREPLPDDSRRFPHLVDWLDQADRALNIPD